MRLNSFTQVISEMPLVFKTKLLEDGYIDTQLVGPIQSAIQDDTYTKISQKLGKHSVYRITHIRGYIYFIVDKDKEIIGGVKINKSEYGYSIVITKKMLDVVSSLMRKLYSIISKDTKSFLFTDSEQSTDSSDRWKSWYNNPKKYKFNYLVTHKGKVVSKPYPPSDIMWGETHEKADWLVGFNSNT